MDDINEPFNAPEEEASPLVISVEEDGNDDEDTDEVNESKFDNADEDRDVVAAVVAAAAQGVGGASLDWCQGG